MLYNAYAGNYFLPFNHHKIITRLSKTWKDILFNYCGGYSADSCLWFYGFYLNQVTWIRTEFWEKYLVLKKVLSMASRSNFLSMNCTNLRNYFNLSLYKPMLHRKCNYKISQTFKTIIIYSNRYVLYELTIIMDISKITYIIIMVLKLLASSHDQLD